MTRLVYLNGFIRTVPQRVEIDPLFGTLHVSIDQHLVQAGLDDSRHQAAVITSDSLHPRISNKTFWLEPLAYLDTLRIHLIIFLHLCPVETSVALLANQQIWIVDLLELEFDRSDEVSCH
jgi:hypothetical protein